MVIVVIIEVGVVEGVSGGRGVGLCGVVGSLGGSVPGWSGSQVARALRSAVRPGKSPKGISS